jgi:hypothetical protein
VVRTRDRGSWARGKGQNLGSPSRSDAVKAKKRETVLLIHGTFAAPKDGRLQWWQPGSQFCDELDRRLSDLGSAARCWAHGRDGPFCWSGLNSWIDRSQGAARLVEELRRLTDAGWRCHMIAHSHGGLVLLEALESLNTNYFGVEGWSNGSLVTMGTPFLTTYRPDRPHQNHTVRRVLVASLFVAAIGIALVRRIFFPRSWLTWLIVGVVLALCLVVGLALALAVGMGRGTARLASEHDRLLVLSSENDEAFHLLSKVNQLENPFRTPTQPMGRLGLRFRAWMIGVADTWRRRDRLLFSDESQWIHQSFVAFFVLLLLLHSVAIRFLPAPVPETIRAFTPLIIGLLVICTILDPGSVIATLCIPARVASAVWTVLSSIVSQVLAWFVSRFTWRFLKKFALGLKGYPFPSGVSQKPSSIAEGFYRCEPLPAAAEKRALARRQQGLSGALDIVAEAFVRPRLSLVEGEEILRVIGGKTDLVHAAYYMEPECLDRMAHWIARKEEESWAIAEERGDLF